MEPSKMLLELPARTAARWVASVHLRDAADAAARGALPDLRDALFRLDAALRAFRPALRDTVRGRHRRRVRELLALTAPAHEAGALVTRAERLLADEPAAAADCEPMLAELAGRRDGGAQKLSRRVDRLARRLRKRLSRYEVTVGPGAPTPPATMGRVLAEALALQAGEARSRFAALGAEGEETGDAARRAAVAVGRLRSLLEPFAAELSDGAALAEELGTLHAALAELLDLDALARELDARAPADDTLEGMLLLARGAQARREEVARRLEQRWRGAGPERLLARVEALAAGIGGAGEDVEIERKYLLSALPELPEGAEALEVEQGWFGERIAERVRRVRSAAGLTAFRAIKHGRGVKRLELEEPISTALFAVLWPLTEGRRVRKRRHRVRDGGLCWEIDEFTDRDLVLAEVELPTAEHPVVFPDWLEPLVVREVTHEGAYVNLNLAR